MPMELTTAPIRTGGPLRLKTAFPNLDAERKTLAKAKNQLHIKPGNTRLIPLRNVKKLRPFFRE